MSCSNNDANTWSSSSKDDGGKIIMSQSPQQFYLLTVAYPPISENNGEVVKTVPFAPNNGGQQQIFVQPVSSVLPISAVSKSKNTDNHNLIINSKESSYTPLVVVNAPLRQESIDSSDVNNATTFLLPNNLTQPANHENLLSRSETHIQFELNENTPVISFEGETLPDFTCTDKDVLGSEEINLRDNVLRIESEINSLETNSASTKETGLNDKDPIWNEIDSDIEDEITQSILDNPVIPRAKQTLPNHYLVFGSTHTKAGVTCVYAKKEIAKRTQFGPMDGVLTPFEKNDLPCPNLKLLIDKPDGTRERLSVDNEELSNWMRYVRVAFKLNDQNLALSQIGSSLYFTSIKCIKPGDELRVWYSRKYAAKRNLPLLSNSLCKWSCPKCPFTSILNKSMNHHLFKHRAEQKKKSLDVKQNQNERIDKTEQIINDRVAWCKECNLRFTSLEELNLHMLTHATGNLRHLNANIETSLNKSQPKDFDSFSEDDLSDLESKSQTDEFLDENMECVINVCDICGRKFKNAKALNLHSKIHYEKTIFTCPICKKTFDKVLKMKSHIKTHSSPDGTFKCPECPPSKVFPTYKQIRRHMKLCHSNVVFNCNSCHKSFCTAFKLKLHIESHKPSKRYLCADCGKQFKRKDKLCAHIKLFHLDKSSEKVMSAKQQKNSANSALFPNNKEIQPDQQQKASQLNNPVSEINTIPDSFKCHECEIVFKKRGVLVNHILNRHPGMPLSSFSDLNHPIIKPSRDYFCLYCDRVYKSSTKRKAHIQKCHPGMKFTIDDKQVNSNQYTHTVGSINSKPACCKWCSKQYSSNGKLLQHQRKAHFNLLPKPLRIPGYYNPADYRKKPQGKKGEDNPDDPDEVESQDKEKNSSEQETNNITNVEITGNYLADGGIIVDGPTLKKALKLGEPSTVECLLDSGLEQLLAENRPDQYFKILTQEGITIAQPVEIWDPLSLTSTQSQSSHESSSTSTQQVQVKSTLLTTDSILP